MRTFVCVALLLGLAVAVPMADRSGIMNVDDRIPPILHNTNDLQWYPLATDEGKSMCLDGSNYGYYFAPASDPSKATTTIIFAQGGGWCYNELDCYSRSFGGVGTSKGWPASLSVGGIMDANCKVSPDFCNVNRVFLPYCDGNSFSGTREEPLQVLDRALYFRGRYNLEASLNSLAKNFTLAKQENILFTGCSAGGLTTFLHADFVGEWAKKNVPTLKKYKAAPLSGFFLNHNNIENIPVYQPEIKKIFELSHPQVNDDCIASKADEDKWQCNFAADTYRHIKSSIFVIDSAVDSWQSACILAAEPVYDESKSHANGNCSAVRNWGACAGNLKSCSAPQVDTYNAWSADFVGTLTSAPTYSKAGNGAFIYSCHTHCAAQGGEYASIKINGVTLQQAVSKWWNDDGSAPASQNSYLPCSYATTAPYQCNPTCSQ